jgi:hypothetical protein
MSAFNDGPATPPSPEPATESTNASDEPRNNITASRARRAINVGVIIAVAGLIFSGVTYVFNRRDQQKADERRARTELTEVISQIVGLPRQYPTGQTDALVNSQFRSELAVLVGAAERLSSEHSSIVGPSDYLALGYANNILLNLEHAIDELAKAEELAIAADDPGILTGARTNAANSYFLLGDLSNGRRMFKRALRVGGLTDVPRTITEAQEPSIRLSWALAEATVGQCLQAHLHLARLARVHAGALIANQIRSNPSWPCG